MEKAQIRNTNRRIGTIGTAFVVTGLTARAIWKEGNAERWWVWPLTQKESVSLPRTYQRSLIHEYWSERPISTAKRLLNVAYELGPIGMKYVAYKYGNTARDTDKNENLIQSMAIEFREALTNLGPAWIKAGQQLAIRPDLVHPIVLHELQKLCDSVRTTMTIDVATKILEREIGINKLSQLKNLELVASASLGQVYKAELNGVEVAVKIQRPNMLTSFSLDLYLLQMWGDLVDSFTSTFTKQAPCKYVQSTNPIYSIEIYLSTKICFPDHRALFDAFSQGSYSELDYEQEAKNQQLFQSELLKKGMGSDKVKIPNVFLDFTTQRVITTEWVDGIPLAKCSTKTIQRLIPIGVELFLVQLLDIGMFHADPHPG